MEMSKDLAVLMAEVTLFFTRLSQAFREVWGKHIHVGL